MHKISQYNNTRYRPAQGMWKWGGQKFVKLYTEVGGSENHIYGIYFEVGGHMFDSQTRGGVICLICKPVGGSFV